MVIRILKSNTVRLLWLIGAMYFMVWEGRTQAKLNFDFGGNKEGFLAVHPNTIWPFESENVVFGLSGAEDVKVVTRGPSSHASFLTSHTPFYFSVRVPEGNYLVTAVLGDSNGTSNTTIKAESRRLMVYDYSTTRGEVDTVSFVVNIRFPKINDTDSIRLKSREYDYLNWDHQLTLEFGGGKPCVSRLSIQPVSFPTVFLSGNSTVVDQDKEPWASWGQMFPLFFKPEVSVANYAESGETLKSFIREKRLDKIASQIKPGDYLFMEFAHNDQKPGGNHVDPYTTYQEYLRKFIDLAKANNATPVLVTSTNRRTFNESEQIENSLGDYPDAMRQLARDMDIALIDLHVMSKKFYEALGPEISKKAFVHYPAHTFSWQPEALSDNTHFSTYGAFQLAKCVVEEIKASTLGLKDHFKADLPSFDPAFPDDYKEWKWPISKLSTTIKPDGY